MSQLLMGRSPILYADGIGVDRRLCGAGSKLHACKFEHVYTTIAGITCCCQGSDAFKDTTGTPASFRHHCHF